MKPSKMEVNAAIEQLVATPQHDAWREWATTILAYTKDLRLQGRVYGQIVQSSTPHDSYTGHTSEIGNVHVTNEGKPGLKITEFGGRREQVGYYKIARFKHFLSLQHFWKADLETSSEVDTPARYLLPFNADNQPMDFGIEGKRALFSISLGHVQLTISRIFFCSLRRIGYRKKLSTQLDLKRSSQK